MHKNKTKMFVRVKQQTNVYIPQNMLPTKTNFTIEISKSFPIFQKVNNIVPVSILNSFTETVLKERTVKQLWVKGTQTWKALN